MKKSSKSDIDMNYYVGYLIMRLGAYYRRMKGLPQLHKYFETETEMAMNAPHATWN